MKICCILRAHTRLVRHVQTRAGTKYEFERMVDDAGVTHTCADVKDTNDQAEFLANGAYYELGQPRLKRPNTGPAAPAPSTDPAPEVTAEVNAEAEALITNTVGDIGKAVGNVSSLAVVRHALRIELRGDNPRKGTIRILEATIEGATQAGVEG